MSDYDAYVKMLNEWAPKVGTEITNMDAAINNCRLIGDDVPTGVYAQLYATILNANGGGKINKELIYIAGRVMGRVIHTALSQPDRCHDIAGMFERGLMESFEKGEIIKHAVTDILKDSDVFIQAASKFFGIEASPVLNTPYESVNVASRSMLH